MTSRDFCYWLQGFFEIVTVDNPEEIKISAEQSKVIQAHLNLVFKHEIDVENLKGKTPLEIQEYKQIHSGAKSGEEIQFGPSHVSFNC